jgi:hypothetical protein
MAFIVIYLLLWTHGKAGALLLEPYLQSILLWLCLEVESQELFASNGLNHDSPECSLTSD